ncbi:MAG: flagellar hook-associated protein FlgK [bacterium]
MSGLFGLYGLGATSLTAMQTAMDAVGHNVANAATPGFHRQRVELEAELPALTPEGALGTGVRMSNIRRVQDQFLEASLRREAPLLSRFTARADVLARTQVLFGEPSDNGLATQLDDFYTGWNSLASNPEDLGARESVVRLGGALADSIRQAYGGLLDEQKGVDGQIASTVDDANRAILELQTMNRSILASTRQGVVAADLEDRRDTLVSTLNELTGATATIESDGTATVRVGGRVLVQAAGADTLTFDAAHPAALHMQGATLQPSELGGQLGGLVDAREGDLADAMSRLDKLAARLAAEVNAVHTSGVDSRGAAGTSFFVLDGVGRDGVRGAAAVLRVNPVLVGDAAKVVAGSSGKPGDGSAAADIAALRNATDGVAPMLQALISGVGARAKESQDLADGQQVVVNSFQAQRDSVSGVSLDEEGAQLLKFQRSYQAAARIVTTVDAMAQTLLQM